MLSTVLHNRSWKSILTIFSVLFCHNLIVVTHTCTHFLCFQAFLIYSYKLSMGIKAGIKWSLWFHGSMLCNWSFWLYIGETGSKINCLLWWGNTRKTRYQRLFWSQRVSVGKEWKIVLDTAIDTHCIYLVRILRGCFDCSSFPQRDFWSYEVRCFHLWPGSPSGSLQRRMDPDTQQWESLRSAMQCTIWTSHR